MGKTLRSVLIAVLLLFTGSHTQAGQPATKYRLVAEATPHSKLCLRVQKGLDEPTDFDNPFSSKVFLPWHDLGYQPDLNLAFRSWLITTPFNDGHEYAILRDLKNPAGGLLFLFPRPDVFIEYLEYLSGWNAPLPDHPSTIIDFSTGHDWQNRHLDSVTIGEDPSVSLPLLTPALAKELLWQSVAFRSQFQDYGLLTFEGHVYLAGRFVLRDNSKAQAVVITLYHHDDYKDECYFEYSP